ncbi:hypothetical protein RclHR1_09840005 [Rhizophagus clarus]|uniref:F-box domain-containing protein n=1 Tax=Rhizophagus clarus TaxID=94130 RepID=A0A2Z6SRC2_9GLOM|nr:hypothetical protein RclHR1_09840005 [Rhizophagus clarus]GES87314.1 hypothetical protein GLOIN_2v1774509 [Rhizophagus clarus]
MLKLNKDVLFLLISENFQDDKKTLYSCLLVNKIWCEVTVPILWKNPWKNPWKYISHEKERSHLNIIISHLSNETRNNLRNKGIDLIAIQQKPLFNYISFCKYLNLSCFDRIISIINNFDKIKISIISNEILKLFINKNSRLTFLYIPRQCNYQIHLIPGVEQCFSELKFLQFDANIEQHILKGLVKISKSIKKLEFDNLQTNNNSGLLVKLIEAQKDLNEVRFICYTNTSGESFCKTLEESLIKHANTVKHLQIDWVPITNVLSHLINLISLEMNSPHYTNWNHLENVFLPGLTILKAQKIPSENLSSLIENTRDQLSEISIRYEGLHNNKSLIQAIYRNCPNLKYLKLFFEIINISELKNLLINCQYLNGLVIITDILENKFDWDNLFDILAKLSPKSLYKFKFYFMRTLHLDSLKLFFDNWKGHPIFLQIIPMDNYKNIEIKEHFNLIENYKVKGIVEKYDIDLYGHTFEDFEWIQTKFC